MIQLSFLHILFLVLFLSIKLLEIWIKMADKCSTVNSLRRFRDFIGTNDFYSCTLEFRLPIIYGVLNT